MIRKYVIMDRVSVLGILSVKGQDCLMDLRYTVVGGGDKKIALTFSSKKRNLLRETYLPTKLC
jgi:hypothetical protein